MTKKTTTTPAREVFAKLLTPEQEAASDRRAAALIEEYHSLQELRKAMGLTQVQLAERMGVGQDGISRLEKREDLLLSTLTGVIQSLGGELELRVNFPDRAPIVLNPGRALQEKGTAPEAAAS